MEFDLRQFAFFTIAASNFRYQRSSEFLQYIRRNLRVGRTLTDCVQERA